MSGPVIVLTGATSGIGASAAQLFARDAGCLILHGRQPEAQARPWLDNLRLTTKPGSDLHYLQADYSDLPQVSRFASDIRGLTKRIDVLINNAGRAGASRRTITADGNEVTLQVNYLAAVALTTQLLPLLGVDSPARVVNVASATHYSATPDPDDLNLTGSRYAAYDAYAHSKLAMVTWSCWLAANRPSTRLEVVSMHPGVIATKILREMSGGRGDPPEVGAGHVHHVAGLSGDNGAYYDKRRRVPPHLEASDRALQRLLHDRTTLALSKRAT